MCAARRLGLSGLSEAHETDGGTEEEGDSLANRLRTPRAAAWRGEVGNLVDNGRSGTVSFRRHFPSINPPIHRALPPKWPKNKVIMRSSGGNSASSRFCGVSKPSPPSPPAGVQVLTAEPN